MSKNLKVSIKYREMLGPRIAVSLAITNRGTLPTNEVLMPTSVRKNEGGIPYETREPTAEEMVRITSVGKGAVCIAFTNSVYRKFDSAHEAELWINRILIELGAQYKKWTKRDRLIAPKDRMVVIKP